ncbi:Histone acetyltransferase ESA1 [Psilocybe cubensis]|uniref:Histone acetyltransferase ESA1 n=2 Tax=Psilocybe cubensis TaxID=181762 RepID=A0ACB8HHE5_PSICU|nr:Histone acetyltransferase ESA1 [Psilocybe cubensis]KAH9487261.1 Histone acetyltransferase ESA1 [Psilocybe cubensis]
MPATHTVQVSADPRVYTVIKNGQEKQVNVVQRHKGEVYVHYIDTDRRMDEWIPEEQLKSHPGPVPVVAPAAGAGAGAAEPRRGEGNKRRRGNARKSQAGHPEASSSNGFAAPMEPEPSTIEDVDMLSHQQHQQHQHQHHQLQQQHQQSTTEVVLTEEEYDLRHHQQLHSQKNFDMVIFDVWKIKPWYFSPYPLTETEADEVASASNQAAIKIPGVARATARSHGRTSDLLAGGLHRQHSGESMLWVCHFCFKYMADGGPWELHKKECKMKHPPGKKVYQRGAHIIWEVDGAKEKLYCQNLSLFGKLFIDVKTLFFDCDNFLFYILTDAKSSEDHILGFFSKEKLSYDDYNLACILTLPQYQKKGYGMLMIEFSYELSRRAGKVGSPERPLSDLGLRSYLAYWISTILRFFRRVLTVLPPDVLSTRTINNFPELIDGVQVSGDVERTQSKKRKIPKGFDGEVSEQNIERMRCLMPYSAIHDPVFTSKRIMETVPRADGGAEVHVRVECTLEDIAKATNLRPDDAAFALNECGLLMHRMSRDHEGEGEGEGGQGRPDTIVVTRELVEKVAKERNVKIMYMDMSCVLLP